VTPVADKRLRVEVADLGADACLYSPDDAPPVLYIRPGQTHESAVRAVQAALGHADDEVARRLVRKHVPDALALEELLAEPAKPEHPWQTAKAAVSIRVLFVVVLLLTLVWALLATDRRHELHSEQIRGGMHQMMRPSAYSH
jgi:hypothetical protein